ncbi:MAG: IclR family transcriptional regulator, regulon repressor [Actinomycetota bacterium]|jgi:DNA-binding IclR family transcriptional regulator|nr:IclR family transcriptional regulator, regulon repressor [Actinomycetota bacterium]
MATISVPAAGRTGGGPHTPNEAGRTAGIDRAMILYEMLRSTSEALRLSDLSRRAGLAKSTTHRLLGALTTSGMVTRVGVGYTAVQRPGDLAPATDRQQDLLRRLAPFVCDALIRTRLTTSLAVLDGPDVVFAHRVYSHDNVPSASDHTGRDRAHRTAAGRLLLSHDLRAACDAAPGWGLDADEAAQLNRELMRIRRCGFAIRETTNLSCLAVALPVDPGGQPIALTIKGRGPLIDTERTIFRLRGIVTAAVQTILGATSVTTGPSPEIAQVRMPSQSKEGQLAVH